MKLSDLKNAGVDYLELHKRLTDTVAAKILISHKGPFAAKDHPGTKVVISATNPEGMEINLGSFPTKDVEAFAAFRRQADLFLANEIDLETLKK